MEWIKNNTQTIIPNYQPRVTINVTSEPIVSTSKPKCINFDLNTLQSLKPNLPDETEYSISLQSKRINVISNGDVIVCCYLMSNQRHVAIFTVMGILDVYDIYSLSDSPIRHYVIKHLVGHMMYITMKDTDDGAIWLSCTGECIRLLGDDITTVKRNGKYNMTDYIEIFGSEYLMLATSYIPNERFFLVCSPQVSNITLANGVILMKKWGVKMLLITSSHEGNYITLNEHNGNLQFRETDRSAKFEGLLALFITKDRILLRTNTTNMKIFNTTLDEVLNISISVVSKHMTYFDERLCIFVENYYGKDSKRSDRTTYIMCVTQTGDTTLIRLSNTDTKFVHTKDSLLIVEKGTIYVTKTHWSKDSHMLQSTERRKSIRSLFSLNKKGFCGTSFPSDVLLSVIEYAFSY